MASKYDKLIDELPTIAELLNGAILRGRSVSRTGKNSACVFVPNFLLGQKVKVIIVPENSEVAGLRKTLDKKNNKISKLLIENKNLKSDSEDPENSETQEVEVDKDLESDDEY